MKVDTHKSVYFFHDTAILNNMPICGFHLALRLSDELNRYEHEHLLSRQGIEDARFDYTDKEKKP